MPNDQTSDGFEDVVNRRNFLRLTGASGVAALAGCGGGGTTTEGQPADTTTTSGGGDTTTTSGGGDTTTTEDTGGNKVYDVTLRSPMNLGATTKLHWNTQFSWWPDIWGRWLGYERYAQYNLRDNKWIPRLIQDWSIDGKTMTLNIREDHKYANGDDLTAEDVKVHLGVSGARGGPLGNLVESWNVVDKHTLEINAKQAVNKKILTFHVLSSIQQSKAEAQYQKWFDKFWKEDKSVSGKIGGWRPKKGTSDKPLFWSGTFSQKEMTDQKYVMERNPEHPDANNVNFKEYRFSAAGSNQKKWQGMINNSYDTLMSTFTPSHIILRLSDNWNEYSFPGYWGLGLVPNHNNEHLGKRNVRQALTNAVNRKNVVTAAAPRAKTAAPTPAAIASSQQSKWIDVGGTFSPMQDKKKVPKLMQDAGYARNGPGNTWAMDGNALRFPVKVPSGWSDWESAASAIAAQLQGAGFDAPLAKTPYGALTDQMKAGKFKLACRPWLPGNARSSYPFFPLRWVFGDGLNNAHNYPAQVGQEKEGQPIEVPAMSGAGTMTVDVAAKLDELSLTRDDATEKSLIKELAWVSHQDLPMIPIVTKKEQSFISTQNLTAPATDAPDAQVKWPCMYHTRTGKMQWKGD